MYENFDGSSSNQTKGAQNVAGRLSVEPEDCVSFSDHNECLKKTDTECNECEAWSPLKRVLSRVDTDVLCLVEGVQVLQRRVEQL